MTKRFWWLEEYSPFVLIERRNRLTLIVFIWIIHFLLFVITSIMGYYYTVKNSSSVYLALGIPFTIFTISALFVLIYFIIPYFRKVVLLIREKTGARKIEEQIKGLTDTQIGVSNRRTIILTILLCIITASLMFGGFWLWLDLNLFFIGLLCFVPAIVTLIFFLAFLAEVIVMKKEADRREIGEEQ
jgi:hypothetical protein